MKCFSYANSARKPGGVVLNISLDRSGEYPNRVTELSEMQLLSCRAVLILTAVLSVLMPLTEHLCRWDKFLRGSNHDLEFGILGLLLFAGVVLLIAHQAAISPFLPLLLTQFIAFPLRYLLAPARSLLASSLIVAWSQCGVPPVPSLVLGAPLRI